LLFLAPHFFLLAVVCNLKSPFYPYTKKPYRAKASPTHTIAPSFPILSFLSSSFFLPSIFLYARAFTPSVQFSLDSSLSFLESHF